MKKIISIVLIIASIMSVMVFAPSAAAAKNSTGADTASKLQLLSAVGILPAISADKLKEGISRADFAIYAANAVKVESGRADNVSYFKDVPADHWALDSINGLIEAGAVTVGEDACFYPQRNITLQETVKIMLSLTGFGPFAEAKGGYPSGYMQIAYERDLLDGVSQSGTFTFSDAVNLIYNAVNMSLLESYAIKGDGVKYATDTDTILSVYHDIYRTEGFVTGIHGISTNDFSAPEEGEIRVDETLYKVGTRDMYSYLGMYVEIFHRENEVSYDDIVTIRTVNHRNKFEDISLNDFNGFNESDYTVSYTDSKNISKKFKLSYGVCVVRNGVVMSENIVNAFAGMGQGSIRIIDNDRDNIYDVAIISEYRDLVVGHIDTENEIVYDKYDPSFNFTLEKEQGKWSMLYNQSGSMAKVTALSIGSIVTVFASENYTRAFYSDTTVKGKISQIVTDEDGTVITIASRFGNSSTDYRLDKEFLTRSGEKLTVGMQTAAKLDIYGRVAYMDIENDEMMYGYLVNQGTKGALSTVLQLKVLTDDGETRVLDCADKVVVDGEKKTSAEDIDIAIKRGKENPDDLTKGQVIRFSLNDDGKVKEVDTLYVGKGGNDKLFITHDWDTRRYSSRSVRFATTAMVGANTVIFRIPKISDTDDPDVLPDDITLADEEDLMTLTTSFFSNSSSYNMQAYKIRKESGFEEVIVYQGDIKKSISTSTDMFVISSIRYELTEDGDYAEAVYGCSSGTMMSYRMAKDFSVKDLGYESGDIIRVVTNQKGEVIDVACVYKYMNGIDPNTNAWIELPEGATKPTANYWEDGRYKTVSSANAWSAFTVAYANVVSTNDNVLKLSRTGYTLDDVDEILKLSSIPVIVIYDKSAGKEKVYKGTLSDLVPGVSAGSDAAKVFVRTEESNLRWIVLYK